VLIAAPPLDGSTALASGALSRLLSELAALPADRRGQAWNGALVPGLVVDRYEMVRPLGRGGFGDVWEARDLKLGRSVAFKAVRAGEAFEGEDIFRAQEEADAAAKLDHPGIVTLFDEGLSEHGPYLVFQLLEGRTLAEALRDGPLPVGEAARVALEVARAVAHAHRHGVVHRDLTTRNVFLCEDGPVKVLDLGLAHAFGHRPLRGGTRGFMAPEQARGAPEDERSDVFALGCLLYLMLSGGLPFPDDDGDAALVGRARARALGIPEMPGLAVLVARALEKDPVLRPRDCGEMARALEACLDPRVPPPAGRPVRVRVRRRVPAKIIAGVALGLMLAVAWRLWPWSPGQRPLVVVADVENLSGDPQLEGLETMVMTALEQPRRLRVMTRSRMLELARQAGHAEVGRIDEALGREIAKRGGARALLLIRLRRLEGPFRFELRALDPAHDTHLFGQIFDAPTKHEILAALDRLCEETRLRLTGESPGEIASTRMPIASFMSADWEANDAYNRGLAFAERLKYPEAVQAFREALARDPRFALAHYALAHLPPTGELTEAEQLWHANEALALGDRLPPRKLSVLQAAAAERRGQMDEALEILARLAADSPDDSEVRIDLGEKLMNLERPAEAAPWFEQALALSPGDQTAGGFLCRALGFLGRTAELQEIAERTSRSAPGASSSLLLAEAAIWADDLDAAVRHADESAAAGEAEARTTGLVARLLRGDPPPEELADTSLRAAVLSFRGRWAEAARVLAGEPLRPGPWASFVAEERVAVAASLRSPELVRGEVDALLKLPSPLVRATAAVVAWSGEREAAARLAGALPAGLDADLHRAVAEFRSGRHAEGLEALRKVSSSHVSGSALVDAYLLGAAELDAGDAQAGAEALRRSARMSMPIGFLWARARGLLLLAQAEEALGRRDEARAAADRLSRYWADADPGDPDVVELRALRARLAR